MFFQAIAKAAMAAALAASMQAAPMAELEAAEHSEPCRVCGVTLEESELYDGYCPECLERYQAGPWCDCCGELLCGSEEFVVCDCHGIHGLVCRECAEWHEVFDREERP